MKQHIEHTPADMCVSTQTVNHEEWLKIVGARHKSAMENDRQGKGIPHEEIKRKMEKDVAAFRERKRLQQTAGAKPSNNFC